MLAAKRAKRAAYMRAYRKRKREEIDEVSIFKEGKITAERKHYPREHIRQQFADGRRSNAEYMRAYRKRKAEQRNAEYSCIPLLIQVNASSLIPRELKSSELAAQCFAILHPQHSPSEKASILEPVVEVEIKEEPFFLEQSSTDVKLEPEKYKPLVIDKIKEENERRNRMTPPDGLALEVKPDIKEQKIYSANRHIKSEEQIIYSADRHMKSEEQKIYSTDRHMKSEISFKMIS